MDWGALWNLEGDGERGSGQAPRRSGYREREREGSDGSAGEQQIPSGAAPRGACGCDLPP